MSKIVIYKDEATVKGLAEKIVKSTVLAYEMPLIRWQPDEKAIAKFNIDLVNAHVTDKDLYYTKSVLVTTNWNLNDDVFDKVETWSARHTPTHKPTNVEHDDKKLVGHIVDCWAMTMDGQIIDDNTVIDELPNLYNLVDGAVIYTSWKDGDLQARANKLIEEIESGKKYVSMECAFTNFGYAILKSDGTCHVLARNEETAWMTKHLRAYGGTGKYDGCKLGRLLKNITFIGRGYVDKPANPNSIIFDNKGVFDFNKASVENPFILDNGVYLNRAKAHVPNTENNDMAEDIKTLQIQLDEVKAALKTALDNNAELETKLTNLNSEKSQAKFVELETKLSTITKEYEDYKKSVGNIQTTVEEKDKTIADLTTKNNDLTKRVDEMVQAQLTANRIAILTTGGIDKEIAEKKVALYATLTDEQFKDLSDDLVEAAKKKVNKNIDTSKPCDKGAKGSESDGELDGAANANETVLEDVRVIEDPNLSVDGEDSEIADIRKELSSAIASRLGIKIENDNEE